MATHAGQTAGVARALLALSTGSLHCLALERVFALAAACGHDGVDLLVGARRDSYDVPYLLQLCTASGVAILSVHTPFALDVEGWSARPEERVLQAMHLAEELGAQTVVAHVPLRWQLGHIRASLGSRKLTGMLVMPWLDRAAVRYADWLSKELPGLQAQFRARVAVENMPAYRLWGIRISLHRFVGIAGLGQLPAVALDTTHCGTWGLDPAGVYRMLRGRVVHVHLSDYDGREHRMPFRGHLRLERLLCDLRKAGFDGVVALEVEPGAVAEGDWSEGHLRQALGEAVAKCRALLEPAAFA